MDSTPKRYEWYPGNGRPIVVSPWTVVAVVALIGLTILVFWPASDREGRLSYRSTCAANLRGITQSMNVYAAGGDWYPIVGNSYTSTLASAFPGPTGPADTLLSNKPGGLYAGKPAGNVAQSMWLLVIGGQVAAKQFLCKEDPAAGTAAPATVGNTPNCYSNFSNDKAYSYSFAFMWDGRGNAGGWWKCDTDAGLPLISDMAPANGTSKPAANTLDGTKKDANSFNHLRDGQNVGYGDGHAEFSRLANVGESNDNIYSANGAGGPSVTGVWASSAGDPGITGGTKGNWDVVLVPAADGRTGVRR